jgi:aryl-alcohol dehydrogenase-like predicted oxidoreductase
MSLAGRATETGTARYAARFAGRLAPDHFRSGLGLTLSSIGAGTYLGDLTDRVDDGYRAALAEAIRCGCNVLDTAASYRAQRSELTIGRVMADLVGLGQVARDELVIASKGGFIAYRMARPANPMQYVYDNFLEPGIIEPDDLAGGIHCMAPNFLSQQIVWSLRNTGLHTLDIYYIHNPETQLAFVDRTTFRRRIQLAFARLEEEVVSGRIGCYGIATWDGLRRAPMAQDYMSLEILVKLATEVAGPGHHLRAVQLPVNALMNEGVTFRNQPVENSLLPALAAAKQLGLIVMSSASMMQGQWPVRLSTALAEACPYLKDDAQRALQLTRSLPEVCTALVGAARPEHAQENLELATHPAEPEKAGRLMRSLPR